MRIVPTACSSCVQCTCCLFLLWLALTNGCSPPVPTPMATFTGGGTVTVGSTASLTYTVTLQHYSSYSSIPITVTVELLKGNTVSGIGYSSGSGAVRTFVSTLSNAGVSNAGQYQCRATVSSTDSNVLDSNAGVSNNDSLTVQGKSSD